VARVENPGEKAAHKLRAPPGPGPAAIGIDRLSTPAIQARLSDENPWRQGRSATGVDSGHRPITVTRGALTKGLRPPPEEVRAPPPRP
jgi:hypothetical protein